MDKEKWTFTLKEISRTGWSFRHFFASFISSYEINADYAPEFYNTDIFLNTTTCSTQTRHTNSRIHTDSHAQKKLPYPRSVALLFIHADVKCCNHTKNNQNCKSKIKQNTQLQNFSISLCKTPVSVFMTFDLKGTTHMKHEESRSWLGL